MRFRNIFVGLLCAAALPAAAAPGAGTMSLAWDPVPGAQGYRIYYGLQAGEYTQSVDVGPTTEGTLTLLEDCRTHYVAIKAYNGSGESAAFSNEVEGWGRPRIEGEAPVLIQSGQFAFNLTGANFDLQADLIFEATDLEGQSLIHVDSLSASSCTQLQALVTVEPTARGFRAMEIGNHELEVRNPGGVYQTGPYEVLLDPERLDINQSDAATTHRVDGKDLVWLAFAYGAVEGDERFNADADISGDGLVDGDDLAYMASVFGSCWDGSSWSEEACP